MKLKQKWNQVEMDYCYHFLHFFQSKPVTELLHYTGMPSEEQGLKFPTWNKSSSNEYALSIHR